MPPDRAGARSPARRASGRGTGRSAPARENDRYLPESGGYDRVRCDGGIPPLSRNHRTLTTGDTRASAAAASLEQPAAIAAQNRWRSSRRPTGGRPGERSLARPDRSKRRRFDPVIATSSAGALRRPIEFGEELAVLNAFRRILRLLRLSAVGIQAEVRISAAQLHVLRQLAADRDGASIGELAEQTLTDRSSVASVVAAWWRRGWPSDRSPRRTAVAPRCGSPGAGKCLVARSSPPLTARLVAALETLGDAELSGLARSLEALVHSMGLDAVTATMLFDDPESNGRAPRRPPQSPGRTRSQGRRRK